ncbi:nuclear transport factor 2 family protein [Leptolyngbya sp. FACHB-261]|uniref:nuclear transport factor 2 family protein n=1 Tax=Leptolyngbya sp. FACHB-261 TaxID=2692806 RepID=UPI00168844C3|nr:nuclear transport factor 2 family protein [Leptolyngbya sp. FACHB-261]MBD2103521.1 nuclear transport factor 2 family protein [Leptolyngbya sp. FACHB-261]
MKKTLSSQSTRKDFLNLGAVAGFSFLLGSQDLLGQKALAQTSSSDHPNVATIKRYYAAYGRGDLATVRQIFAPNIVWHIPGHHPLAGSKRGPNEVFAFFEQLDKANFKADLIYLGGNDNYVIDCHRGYGAMGEAKLDIPFCLLFRMQGGRIVEATNFVGDQHAADAFFWSVYPLKPIPGRLAHAEAQAFG